VGRLFLAPSHAEALLLAAVMAARPDWLVERLHAEGAGRGALEYVPPDDRCLAIRQRSHAKKAVLARLLAGETTLLVTAAWFSRIDPHPAGEVISGSATAVW
jgi:hypothetical protein